jgi:hypothetical protein
MNALARVVESTKYAAEYPPVEILQRQEVLLKERRAKLFEVEREAAQALDKEISNVIQLKAKSTNANKYAGLYLPIDMKCLEWRDEEGLPVLALFDINSPHNYIQIVSEDGKHKSIHQWPDLPPDLDKYTDVRTMLIARANKRSKETLFRYPSKVKSSITAQFQGMIPEATREKMLAARKEFNKVYIMSEVKYKISDEETPIPVRNPIDPLILGYAGNGQLWLIDQFDVTPLEEAVIAAKQG